MSYWLEYGTAGEVLAAYSGAGEHRPLRGGTLLPVDHLHVPDETMVIDGSPVDFGPRPSDLHVMDIPTRSWVLPGPPVDPTPAQIAALVAVLQAELDRLARLYSYDDIKSAITYRGDPNPRFAAEADAFFLLRSQTWTIAYAYIAEAQQGLRPFPITDAEAIAMMPALDLHPPL